MCSTWRAACSPHGGVHVGSAYHWCRRSPAGNGVGAGPCMLSRTALLSGSHRPFESLLSQEAMEQQDDCFLAFYNQSPFLKADVNKADL